jgi:hypothetical protein
MGLGPSDGISLFQWAMEKGPLSFIGMIAGALVMGSTLKMTQTPTRFGVDLTYYSDAWVRQTSSPAALLPSFIVAGAIGAVVGLALSAFIAALRGL